METFELNSYSTASYLLVIEPHAALAEEIMGIRQRFADQYDCPSAAHGKPALTLVRFEQFEMAERRIVTRLESIARERQSFMVELNGFGSLPTHSIYLNVTTHNQVVELVRSLRVMQAMLKIDKDRKPHYITDPQLIIARKLLPWQYEKGWLELSNTHFSGRFMATHLVLLRKRMGEKQYSTLKRFQLLDEKEAVTQGALFT